jgi:hypothetical protein
MKRDIYQELILWKRDKYRKPLVLRGARQVGKTYILSEFAKEYENKLYINFEEMPEAIAIFEGNLSPDNIINRLQIQFKVSIEPKKTLLIFDEIQECPGALNSLKYFNEEANDYHVVSAGSLLGVKLNRTKGFPVGKVDFLDLKPLSFFEFLEAMGEGRLRKMLEEIDKFEPINEALHQKSIDLLKQYFIVGGMPEAIEVYAKEKDFGKVRKVQKSILDAYALDFAKHAEPGDVMKIMSIWESIPNQLAKENKKFIFSAISKSTRAREYESSIQWLVDAGLIYKVFNVSTPKIPLDNYADKNAYKIYALDVGLLGYMSRLPVNVILQQHQLFVEFKGALTENFVVQELMARRFDKMYYWTSEGTAEVDFVLPHELDIYPLEVKSGISGHKKSLLVYDKKYHPKVLSRANLMNLKQDGSVCNYPLYLVSLFPICLTSHRSLFQSYKVKNLELRNRFVMSAAEDNLDNDVSKRVARYSKLAGGDVGLIMTGGSRLSVIESFKPLVDAVHQKGGKIAIQIVTEAGPGFSPTRVFNGEPVAVSVLPENNVWFNKYIKFCKHHAASEEEIKNIIYVYVKTAVKAKEIGADAIQIHAAHQSFPSQFLSPITNLRTDKWGGSIENRTRFHCEIYKAIRVAVGKDYPILIKLGVEDALKNGLNFNDGLQAAKIISECGYDVLEISQGLQNLNDWNGTPMRMNINKLSDEAYFRKWSGEIKKQINKPVILTGGIRSLEAAEEVVNNNECDLIGMCRPLIRESDLINRWQNGNIQKATCISCNQCITELLIQGKPLECYLDIKPKESGAYSK